MTVLITVSLILAGLIGLVFIAALFAKKEYNVQRHVVVDVSSEKAFYYLKQLKNQDNFNKWVMVDPGMKREFKGTDGTVGFVYAWNGNKKAGEGAQEIKAIVEGQRIETEICFIRPFAGIAYANLLTEALSSHQTKVSWSNVSSMRYPLNGMRPIIQKMLAKDMDASLQMLKTILEKQ